MAAQKKIRLVSSQSDELRSEMFAIQEARARVEAENSLELAVHVRARAEAQARAIAEGKLRQENDLLALIEIRKSADLKLVKEVQENLAIETRLKAETNEKLQLEANLKIEIQNKLIAAEQAKLDLRSRVADEMNARDINKKAATLDREAASLAQEKARFDEEITRVLAEKISSDKEALSLLEGKLIAETARAEGARRLVQDRAGTLSLLKQAELEEIELSQCEIQTKKIAQDRIVSVENLKIVAQQRVEVELLAARGIEIQLKAEQDAVDAANKHTEQAKLAKQAADARSILENEHSIKAAQQLAVDELIAKEIDIKLDLINQRIQIAEQQVKLLVETRQAEENKLELENAVLITRHERIEKEQKAIEVFNEKLLIEEKLCKLAQLKIQAENDAIDTISQRMEAEQQAIDADNARFELEARAKEIFVAQLKVTEEIVVAAKLKEECEISVLRMSKFRAEAETQAAQAESDLIQAHKYANKLALKREVAARDLKVIVDERVLDEQFYLELDHKIFQAEVNEHNLTKDRVQAKQRYLAEVEARISAEKQAALVSSQRQIAEQLLRQSALEKSNKEKQILMALKPNTLVFHDQTNFSIETNFIDQRPVSCLAA